jgi:hypothetical protein
MGDLVECPCCGYTLSKAAQRYARAGLRCRHCRKCEVADFCEPEPPEMWHGEHYEKSAEERELDRMLEGTGDVRDNSDWGGVDYD